MRQAAEQRGVLHKARLERAEFAVQFEESRRTLWCIAAAVLGGRELADDVLQESALIAIDKIDDFDAGTSFTAWMGQIVRYVALNAARQRARRMTVGSIDRQAIENPAGNNHYEKPAALNHRGELNPDQRSFDDRVLTALNTLTDTARACLLLRVVLDKPYREIALALGVPEGTAMSHVHRSRRALRDILSSAGPVASTQSGVDDE